MFRLAPAKDKDVVDVDDAKVFASLEGSHHCPLESQGRVLQSERHDSPFPVSTTLDRFGEPECCQRLGRDAEGDLVEAGRKVQLREDTCGASAMEQHFNSGERKRIINGYCIQIAEVNTEPPRTLFLLDKQNRCSPR